MSEEELLELLLEFAPEGLWGWAAWVMGASAFLSIILPKPADDAHPAWKICHRAICILGLGAGKLRVAGKLGGLAKLGGAIIRGKK